MQRLSLLLVPGLIAVLLFIGISSFEEVTSDLESGDTTKALDYDAVSEGISTVLYDTSGNISYTLRADRQIHYNDDSTEFVNPFIRLFRNGGSRWNIVAESGKISAIQADDSSSNRNIELRGNVEVYSLDQFGHRTQLSTEFLSIDPELETLESDLAVSMITTNIRQTAIGMFADLKIDEIVFHRNVRGSYENPN